MPLQGIATGEATQAAVGGLISDSTAGAINAVEIGKKAIDIISLNPKLI
ncbi:hypothetical protein P9057_01885 [Gallibacterium anatis]|uniref:Uncharacterized protein n=1 Tax=Gallibacterium anatis TaxID=750 RepID=A0A921HAU7_9PAST|nr:hypothetical protein [Gallibacterium anatis]MDK9430794.1 hypothetical protein [Gallibacterium anatis]MDK9561338.1 hypothetical protein [Gallibacterium anatis]WIM80859.1 hypothetical protein QP018_06420 [Gallibacterium anatis]WKS96492.1 hypothetical protein NYR19_08205 [Gallibacterium anatis]HJF73980.1 hypothetical protein [Gallibacterium anatis]